MELIRLNDVSRESRELHAELMQALEGVVIHSNFIFGPEVSKFEEEFKEYCGSTYALGISNGTDALILALRALGVGSGDEVITTTMSFMATAAAIVHVGATPVFVDVFEDTLSMNTDAVRQAVTEKTKAIIPVHLYGIPAEMDSLRELCKEKNLLLIEDCAQSQGATYKGKKTGTFGDVGCFSFMPSKNLGAWGDAGGIITDNGEVYKKIKNLYNHGRDDNGYVHTGIGFTSRLDSIHAAILSVKLKYLDQRNAKRREIAQKYDAVFAGSKVGYLNPPSTGTPVYYMYPVVVENRDEVKQKLYEKNIETSIHYPTPLHLQPALSYLGYHVGDFPIVENMAKKILSIPMHPFLSDDEIAYIGKTLLECTE